MTDLQNNLRHLLSFYAVPGTDLDKVVADIERLLERPKASELDDKLERIIFGDMPKHFMSDSMLAKPERIKQAFIDAGWVHTSLVNHPLHLIKDGEYVGPLRSGREFYNRYQTELKGKVFPYTGKTSDDITTVMMICEDAVKRAAGIKQ